VYRDYAPQGVKIYYIYKSLAHPEHNGYVQPITLKERLMHITEAKRTLGTEIPWICDAMENNLKHSLGNAPNSEFIIDPQGIVVRSRSWSKPGQVRDDLEELVGPVENSTTIADLNLKKAPPPKIAAKGVVKRIELPGSLSALRIEPVVKEKGQPFYAKLRAEATNELTRNGKGKLYLAFHMDQIYHVHWNNLTKPIRVKLEPQSGIEVGKTSLEGPKVEEPADSDPREFLIDVDAGETINGSIRISVSYFACNDEEGWCKPVTQEYVVFLDVDRDGGRANRRGSGSQNSRGKKGFRGNRSRGKSSRAQGKRPPSGGFGKDPFGPGRRPPFSDGERTFGRISKIDLKNRLLTVWTRGRDEVQYKVHPEARIVRDEKPVKLADFKPGEFVMLRIEKVKEGPPVIKGIMQRPGSFQSGGRGPFRRPPR
jgi:hypothetical protein